MVGRREERGGADIADEGMRDDDDEGMRRGSGTGCGRMMEASRAELNPPSRTGSTRIKGMRLDAMRHQQEKR
jgi:hypothetical protein